MNVVIFFYNAGPADDIWMVEVILENNSYQVFHNALMLMMSSAGALLHGSSPRRYKSNNNI